MLEFILRIGLGAFLFTLILWLAQSRSPRIAGMMLTFPALNGIGLLTGEPAALPLMARAMMPMIAVNGLLCAGYILALRYLANIGCGHWRGSGIGLSGISLVGWFAIASMVAPPLQQWLVSTSPLWFVLGYAVLVSPLLCQLWSPAQGHALMRSSWWQVVQANWERVLGLVALLVLVMLCVRFGANAWAGRLSALPLLPLYTLALMASRVPASSTDWGMTIPAQMGSTVLLGPVVAILFVWGFVRYLEILVGTTSEVGLVTGGVVGLLVGWGLCGGMIWGVVSLIRAKA